jgi:hypothetical protein
MSYQDYPPPSGYGQWGPPPPQTSSNATVALVLGICGFVVCPLICSILAIVFATKAYREIDGSGGRIGGRGLAQAGLILGWIGVGFCALGLLFFAAWIVFAIGLTASEGGFDAIAVALRPLY